MKDHITESLSPYLPDCRYHIPELSSHSADSYTLHQPSDISPSSRSPRPHPADGTANFDLTEEPNLHCDLSDEDIPAYLRQLTQATFPLAFAGTPGASPASVPSIESLLQRQKELASQILASASSPHAIKPVVAEQTVSPPEGRSREGSAMEDIKELGISDPSDQPAVGSSDAAAAKGGSTRGRRGRKKKWVTAEAIAADTQKKLEKNREFARENRRRKKMYISTLENQVSVCYL